MPEITQTDDADLTAHLVAQLADAAEKVVTPWERYKATAEQVRGKAYGVVVSAERLDALQRALDDLLVAIPDNEEEA